MQQSTLPPAVDLRSKIETVYHQSGSNAWRFDPCVLDAAACRGDHA